MTAFLVFCKKVLNFEWNFLKLSNDYFEPSNKEKFLRNYVFKYSKNFEANQWKFNQTAHHLKK